MFDYGCRVLRFAFWCYVLFRDRWFVVCCLLFVCCCLWLFVVRRASFVVCCWRLLFVVCCVLACVVRGLPLFWLSLVVDRCWCSLVGVRWLLFVGVVR